MKKNIFILFLTLILVVSFSSCLKPNADFFENESSVTDVSVSAFNEISSAEVYSSLNEESEKTEDVQTQPVTENIPATDVSEIYEVQTTARTVQEETTSQPVVTETGTTEQEKTTAEENTTVDLSVELPEANGKIYVDTSASNKFTATVAAERKVAAKLLAAVYSVPASGQNYVLEFYDENGYTKDNLRRVYLLDDNCKITSVAAAKSSEKENISSTENWFCFNVLIKGVIFDAVAEDLK